MPGERIPQERVWAPWLPSQRYPTREHDGRYLCQRGCEQRRLHILQRVHLQTRWTLKFLSALPWSKVCGVYVSCKHSLRLVDHILVLKKNVWACEVCEVSACVCVGLPGRIRPKLKQMFFIVLVLVLYAGSVYICLQNITIFPSFSQWFCILSYCLQVCEFSLIKLSN